MEGNKEGYGRFPRLCRYPSRGFERALNHSEAMHGRDGLVPELAGNIVIVRGR